MTHRPSIRAWWHGSIWHAKNSIFLSYLKISCAIRSHVWSRVDVVRCTWVDSEDSFFSRSSLIFLAEAAGPTEAQRALTANATPAAGKVCPLAATAESFACLANTPADLHHTSSVLSVSISPSERAHVQANKCLSQNSLGVLSCRTISACEHHYECRLVMLMILIPFIDHHMC